MGRERLRGEFALQLGIYLCLCISAKSTSADSIDRFPAARADPDYNVLPVGATAGEAHTIGDITKVEASGAQNFSITCGADVVRIQFLREDIVRVWVGWNGSFTDTAGADIVVITANESFTALYEDAGDHYIFSTSGKVVSLVATKSPMRLSMHRGYGAEVLWQESVGLTVNSTSTHQQVSAAEDEHFFGGGMQNGRFSHRDHRVRISKGSWADGDNPNAVPVYMSSAGYGVYRNTWQPGVYDFTTATALLSHHEQRFDAYYFVSKPRDFKGLLGQYVTITGPPFMPPIYALGLGDSDCYHNARHGNDTGVVQAVAAKYRELDMPGTWFLPNDGYGCGYGVGPSKFPRDFDTLDRVSSVLLNAFGFKMGLWSSTGLPNISREVKGSKARVFKTDVGWIGRGYKYALDAVKLCASGIEDYSNARRFTWTVEGWAGTHRYAVMWTGDDAGSFDYIRWQVPTFVGSGFSAQAHVSGDVDGIFGGSPETYVRDLQFKCFMTVLMVMSGWAKNPDKQPWTWGEPYTSINRMFLKLKARLTPYHYTLSRVAYDTGVPPVRAMAMEFPDDNHTLDNSTGDQFMSGPFLLVAPVFRPLTEATVRDGIYLPAGDWVDFWTGAVTPGPKIVDGYPVPLETLPVFVRAGAIIPMWPEMLYPGQRPATPLTIAVYPSGNTSFELYEDDGETREALEVGKYATTMIRCEARANALKYGGNMTVYVDAAKGSYTGILASRFYWLEIHTRAPPKEVTLKVTKDLGADVKLLKQQSLSGLDYVEQGWAYSHPTDASGKVLVKTKALLTAEAFEVHLFNPKVKGAMRSEDPWAGQVWV
mmetsp:Transcript_21908/g.50010  ORF Transcript_21908/g.50010 Transcript_21908/m.50010 type:complete len:821 (+) Transcript_21908:62-2524(+)